MPAAACAGLLALAHAQSSLKVWDQCGGKGGSCTGEQCADQAYPGATCPTGATCTRHNEWYYQCLMSSSGHSIVPNVTTHVGSFMPVNSGLKLWEQCGGKGGCCYSYSCLDGEYPSNKCPAHSTCGRHNEWYWQCMPGSGTPAADCSPAPSTGGSLKLHDQCGGLGGNCHLYTCLDGAYPGWTCPAGSQCKRKHSWYHQCKADGDDFFPGSGAGDGSGGALKMYDQCGGKGGNCAAFTCADAAFTGYSCPADAVCDRKNEWYFQCVPPGSIGHPTESPAPVHPSPMPGNSPMPGSSPSPCSSPQPGESPHPGQSPQPSQPSPSPNPNHGLQIWDQCGGAGGNCASYGACADKPYDGKPCPSGSYCQRSQQWYWQCLPEGSSPGGPCEAVSTRPAAAATTASLLLPASMCCCSCVLHVFRRALLAWHEALSTC